MGEQRSVKDRLLELAKLRTDVVEIDGLSLTIREVGALEFAKYGALQKADRVSATAWLIANCVIDETGAPVLTHDEAKQLANSARVAMPIVGAILKLSGFGGDAEKEPDAG